MENRKNIILHDTFLYKWWWERLIIMMAKALKADIASGFFSHWSFDLRLEWFEWKLISVSSEVFKKWLRHLKLKLAFLFNTKFLKNYDTIIFSWDCISAVRNAREDAKKIFYCHTPPRYLYDLRELYLKKVPFILRPFFNLASIFFRKMYERDIKKMDLILTNSINTKNRIKEFLWLEAHIVYPPVILDRFKYISTSDYYLSFARLAWAKRVDRIAEAFQKMPDKKLKIIHGINDPQKEEIIKLAKWYKNIEIISSPSDEEFYKYIWNCLATIYIPVNEDFWMSPVESMAAGKPCIWVNEGWLKESIIDGKTGILINKWAEINDIIEAVKILTPEKCLEMRTDCEARARDFSYEHFEKEINDLVNNLTK
ncbi:MAG: glycosyl transferase group 1 [uncultured bacterium (gcode 4)]|uniref:Glycosyl transferase group 1 n=1 Tax=uncultured bacterium (gcode 4) TaxID=1234023 RepID=K2BVC3_9BACT|nr:MAG: glycosyl transferase group 1 [uncultured bacterium (gcode 4)]